MFVLVALHVKVLPSQFAEGEFLLGLLWGVIGVFKDCPTNARFTVAAKLDGVGLDVMERSKRLCNNDNGYNASLFAAVRIDFFPVSGGNMCSHNSRDFAVSSL
jgi:hypothetical protein